MSRRTRTSARRGRREVRAEGGAGRADSFGRRCDRRPEFFLSEPREEDERLVKVIAASPRR